MDVIQAELEKVASNDLTPTQFLQQIKEVSGLLIERELGIYEFAHLSFPRFHSYPADIFQLSAALFLSATAHFITNLFPCPSQSVYHLTAVPCHTVYCFHLLFI